MIRDDESWIAIALKRMISSIEQILGPIAGPLQGAAANPQGRLGWTRYIYTAGNKRYRHVQEKQAASGGWGRVWDGHLSSVLSSSCEARPRRELDAHA